MGVDVGGPVKAFDVALLDGDRVVDVRARQTVADVIGWVRHARPAVVAIDGPRSCAPAGATHRPDEKRLRDEVCGIRWTPEREKLEGNRYYEWIVEGLELYNALRGEAVTVIECFPTASWTRWYGLRDGRPRSAWSREALAQLGLEDVPARTNQDTRDAIAAAATARDYERGRCECFGEIVVPCPTAAPHPRAELPPRPVASAGGGRMWSRRATRLTFATLSAEAGSADSRGSP